MAKRNTRTKKVATTGQSTGNTSIGAVGGTTEAEVAGAAAGVASAAITTQPQLDQMFRALGNVVEILDRQVARDADKKETAQQKKTGHLL